jgi:hypothetical protein
MPETVEAIVEADGRVRLASPLTGRGEARRAYLLILDEAPIEREPTPLVPLKAGIKFNGSPEGRRLWDEWLASQPEDPEVEARVWQQVQAKAIADGFGDDDWSEAYREFKRRKAESE